jgi:hypothetical protein
MSICGIGAIGDQRIGAFDHQLRDIAVQVEAGDERNVRADQGSHASQQPRLRRRREALADHGAVQIEIDPIEGQRGFQPGQQPRHDLLESRRRDMSRRARRAPQGRQQGPADGTGMPDKSRRPDIDVVDRCEDRIALGQARPAAAVQEGLHAGLARRKSVGFVQETTEGDAR